MGQNEADACEAVRGAVEAAGVTVRSVALEHDPIHNQGAGRLRTAYVRLPPPALPWAQWAQNGSAGGNEGAQVW